MKTYVLPLLVTVTAEDDTEARDLQDEMVYALSGASAVQKINAPAPREQV